MANDGIPVIQAHSSQYEEAEVLYQAAEKTTKERVKRQLAMIARLGGKTREKNPTREAMGQLADALGRATGNGEITWERTTGNAERPDRFEAEVDEAKCLLLSQGNLLKDKTVLTILENDRVIGELRLPKMAGKAASEIPPPSRPREKGGGSQAARTRANEPEPGRPT